MRLCSKASPQPLKGLNDSMACEQFDGATIRADVLDTIQESRHRGLNDAIDEYYNDEILEKTIMQIGR